MVGSSRPSRSSCPSLASTGKLAVRGLKVDVHMRVTKNRKRTHALAGCPEGSTLANPSIRWWGGAPGLGPPTEEQPASVSARSRAAAWRGRGASGRALSVVAARGLGLRRRPRDEVVRDLERLVQPAGVLGAGLSEVRPTAAAAARGLGHFLDQAPGVDTLGEVLRDGGDQAHLAVDGAAHADDARAQPVAQAVGDGAQAL